MGEHVYNWRITHKTQIGTPRGHLTRFRFKFITKLMKVDFLSPIYQSNTPFPKRNTLHTENLCIEIQCGLNVFNCQYKVIQAVYFH